MGRPRGARGSEAAQQRGMAAVQVAPAACTPAEPGSVGMVPAPWGLFWPLLTSVHLGEAVAGGGGGPGEALVGFGSVPGEAPGASQRRSGAHPGVGCGSCPGGGGHLLAWTLWVAASVGSASFVSALAEAGSSLSQPRAAPGQRRQPQGIPAPIPRHPHPTFGHPGAASSITWCCPHAPGLVP